MHIEDRILALAARKLANGASEDELNELDELLQRRPDIQNRINLITEWWHRDTGQNTDAKTYPRFQKILEQIKNNRFEG
jgi:hypothetical protein